MISLARETSELSLGDPNLPKGTGGYHLLGPIYPTTYTLYRYDVLRTDAGPRNIPFCGFAANHRHAHVLNYVSSLLANKAM